LLEKDDDDSARNSELNYYEEIKDCIFEINKEENVNFYYDI
jgi:hypothetical protein